MIDAYNAIVSGTVDGLQKFVMGLVVFSYFVDALTVFLGLVTIRQAIAGLVIGTLTGAILELALWLIALVQR